MCRKLLFLISFVAVVVLACSSFAATTYTVGPSVLFDYQTIEQAYGACVTGDTIEIHAASDGGTLAYNPDVAVFKNNDSIHDITFKAYQGDNIRIRRGLDLAYKTGWTFDGFNFSDLGDGYYGVYLGSARANFVISNITIKNCIFANLNSDAIYGYSANYTARTQNVAIENCTFMNLSMRDAIRVNNYNYGWTVKDCIFSSVKRWDTSITGWGGNGISANNGDNIFADYSSFYDGAPQMAGRTVGDADGSMGGNVGVRGSKDPNGKDQGYYGIWAVKTSDNIAVNFIESADCNDPLFGYLDVLNDSTVKGAASDGGYRGARPVWIPEPATIALLGLGGLALLRKRR